MEGTYPAVGNQQFSSDDSPQVAITNFQQALADAEYTVENLLDASFDGITQSDPHSSGAADEEWDWDWLASQLPPNFVGGPSPGTTEEMLQSPVSDLLSSNYIVQVVHPTTNMGSSTPDLDVKAGAGLPQSGGGAFTEAPVPGSCKRKRLARGWSSQRPTPESKLVNLEPDPDPIQSELFFNNEPPIGSTDREIIDFLNTEESCMPNGKQLNVSLGMEEHYTAPTAPKSVRSYVTTVHMMPEKTLLGVWKEKHVKPLRRDESGEILSLSMCGLKRTFQFHEYDGTKTNWFMDEYIPTDLWGYDQYVKRLRFRKVYYKGELVPGEPRFPQVKTKNKIAAVKHRKRGPGNLVIKGESTAWQHLIKIFDRHPEQVGSHVIYGVCCHGDCEGVLKAENGTRSLLNHCNSTCRKNKNQKPIRSPS